MRRFTNIHTIFVLTIIVAVLQSCGNMRVVTTCDGDVVKQFSKNNTIYRIKGNVNLGGKTVKIGNGSTLDLRDGSLNNGTLTGDFKFRGAKKGSLNVKFSKCNISGVVPIYNNGDVVGLITSCVDGCKLMENLTIEKPIYLRASLNGNSHTITSTEKASVAVYINDSRLPIIIESITLRKLIPKGTINKNYAINSTNSSNITIKNSIIDGRVRFANTTMSDAAEVISENISFLHTKLYADFSSCPQGWEYGQDHLSFYSMKNVLIENCVIESKDVNRVLKTSAYFKEKDYDHPQNCTDGVVFRNNTVKASSIKGKQFWDMYCGTVNVLIEGNIIEIQGFTRFVEDKAYQKKYKGNELLSSLIEIKNNKIYIENGNLFQFKANSEVDSFKVAGNDFTIAGANVNPYSQWERGNIFLLQGYMSFILTDNTITLKDEAIGLPLAIVNYNCMDTKIMNNVIIDASRIYFRSANSSSGNKQTVKCDRFEYIGNKRIYSVQYGNRSKMEIYVTQSDIGEMSLSIPGEPVSDDNVIEFGVGANVRGLSLAATSPNRKKLFRVHNSKDTKVSVIKVPDGTVRRGMDWIR